MDRGRLEAEKLHKLTKSISRGGSTSPDRSRSTSVENELKWSITSRDPSERLFANGNVDDDVSEEEHISDDDTTKFTYDATENIIPNFANDSSLHHVIEEDLISKIETLSASERALANAKSLGNSVDEGLLTRIKEDKQRLTGNNSLGTSLFQLQAERKQKLEGLGEWRKTRASGTGHSGHEVGSPSRENADTLDEAGKLRDEDYALYRDKVTHDKNMNEDFMVPYTSAVEDKLDSEFASQLNQTIREGELDSNRAQSRVIQTITRGNFFQLIDPNIKPKMFLVCMDFSPESIFALEWCLGTVLVDGSVLFIVGVIEETDSNHNLKSNSAAEAAREKARLNQLEQAKAQILALLKLTKLQIHIVIEIVHHPIPRHLIMEIIDNLQPTLVVVGSRGQSAIKGVLLGSLSNFLVTKSSVPVMVVREKLKMINRFKTGSNVFSNNIKPLTLSEARID